MAVSTAAAAGPGLIHSQNCGRQVRYCKAVFWVKRARYGLSVKGPVQNIWKIRGSQCTILYTTRRNERGKGCVGTANPEQTIPHQ